MDLQELYKLFGQRLENALKSKENFKGKNRIKFIEITDGTCCFHYNGQDFTVEWWIYEKEQCIDCSFYCHEVQTTAIDFDFESFDYSLDLVQMETEEDIDSNISDIVDGIKNCYIGSNVDKILNMAEKMAKAIDDLDGNEGDNKFMLKKALRYYDVIK
jgi:hypothetical protein